MIPKNPIEFYNSEAAQTERYGSTNFWERRYHKTRQEIIQALLRSNAFPACDSFADIGCGTGEYLGFSRRFVHEVDGVDLSSRYLRRCKKWNPDGLVASNVKLLPFRDKAFDCVLCSEVIEHVKELDESVDEVLRIARKFVLISTPNHGILRSILSRFSKKLLDQIDGRVGHVNVMKFPALLGRVTRDSWRFYAAFTALIFPPLLDDIGFPKCAGPVIHALEVGSNRLLPTQGSISFVLVARESS
jgi:ubiquinone/menaquinone biosynthesis C-methylase UbiE